MSIFNTREFWSVDLSADETFDANSLLVFEEGIIACIFLASHSGYLRCYTPNQDNTASALVLETLFSSPVLQLKKGSFVSGSHERQLAVLHPRSVAVYHIQRVESSHAFGIALRHAYQHNLHRSAHSLVGGSFGNVTGRDFLCIQSLDGLLSFFEQESPTFEIQLPDTLLPGPFQYLETVDCFLLQDANLYLVCYSYESLSDAERKIPNPIWNHNIGENILEINCLNVIEAGLNIIVLTERNLYNFNDKGGIVWMKRFECRLMCLFSYINQSNNSVMNLLCTEFQTLQIYQGTCLKWSAKLEFLPIQIYLGNFGNVKGLIILLSDSGRISSVYLGTIPSLYLLPPTTEPDINVFQAEEELKRLQQEITKSDFVENLVDDILDVNLIVDSTVNFNGDRNICRVSMELIPQVPINKVQVQFIVNYPLVCSTHTEVVSSVCKKETVETNVYVSSFGAISNLQIAGIVSYLSPNGIPRIIQRFDEIPMEVGTMIFAAEKDAQVKLVIGTNKPTCGLNEIFPGSEGTANAVGIGLINSGAIVSIIAAKTSQRYRIQTDRFEDITLVLDVLIQRLKRHFRRSSDFTLTFGGSLPLQSFFQNVEKHYELITRKRSKQEMLAQIALQYRTIQKKVLVSLKDLTPKPTTALHKVLDDTYSLMKTTIDDLEQLDKDLQVSRCRIASISRMIVILLDLLAVNKDDLNDLKLAFNPAVIDNDEQGWLEVQNATLNLLLRTAFAKSSKDQNRSMELTLEPLSDVSKLCKNFSTIIDRVTKGANLMERAEFDGRTDELPTVPSVKKWEQSETKIVPAGSKLVDFTTPMNVNMREKGTDERNVQMLIAQEVSLLVPVQTKVTIEMKGEQEEPVLREVVEVEEDIVVAGPDTLVKKQLETVTTEKHQNKNGNIGTKKSGIEDDDMWDLDIDELRI